MMFVCFYGFILFYSCKSAIIADQINNKQNTTEIKEYKCTELNISLNNPQAVVYCNKKMKINYEDFEKYQFINVDCPVYFQFDQNYSYPLDYKLSKVLPSLKLTTRKDIFFSYYEDMNSLTPFIKILPYENVEFWMDINESTEIKCEWSDSVQIFDFYYSIINNTDWKLVCYSNHYMLHLNDNIEFLEVINPPENLSLILIIVLAIIVIVILI